MTTLRQTTAMAALGCALVAGCRAPTTNDAIRDVLMAQKVAWNEGDLDSFMQHYVNSNDLTFSAGGATLRGWDDVKARYERRYPDAAARGTLDFTALEVFPLGPDIALVLGDWRVTREAETLEGNFSLVFKQALGRWQILHDHTSARPPEE